LKYTNLTACPICKHTGIKQLLIGTDRLHKINGSWPLWQCEQCQVGFLNPMPNSDIIGNFYPQNYYAYTPPTLPERPSSTFKRALWHWRQQRTISNLIKLGYPNLTKPHIFYRISTKLIPVKQNQPRYVPNGTFLDIGCGAGHHLLQMKAIGWNVTGVELSEPACNAAKKAGLNVYHGSLENIQLDSESFDIVRMSDVLEHVPDPHYTLREIYRILKPNGKLEVTLPNLNAWTFKLFGEYWFPLEIPRHLFHHTPKSIKIIAQQHGFKIETLHIWSHKEVDVIPSLQWYLHEKHPTLYKLLNHKFLWKIIRKIFALPKAIAAAKKMGSAMTVTMIKEKQA